MKSEDAPLVVRAKGFVVRWRVALLAVSAVVLVVLGGVVVGGWYFSDRLKGEALLPDRDPDEMDLQVVSLGEDRVTLRATEKASDDGDWTEDGLFGLEWEGGYGQVGSILRIDDEHVVREFSVLHGAPEIGELARLDSFAFPGDPEQARGIGFEEVTITSELGDFPAWFVEGSRDTWVIFVHGRGASRREALRMLPTVVELEFPSLIITYRNDVEAPASPDGFYRFGKTEWEDLEAAADYALQHGAKELVLVGYSMGGAIATSFLYKSPLAERVRAVIFDAPLLDFGAAVDWGVRNNIVPGVVITTGKIIAESRFDFDFDDLNYLKRADELTVPMLLFHGDDDPTAPVATSDALAEARPDIVTYVRVVDAGHVRSWNADPAAYEASVRDFLERVAR